jgi:hypothetical protein
MGRFQSELDEWLKRSTIHAFADGVFPEAKERELIELTLELANAPDQYDVARAVGRFRDWYNVGVGSRGDDESDESWEGRQPMQVAAVARRRLALIAKERALPESGHTDSVRDELLDAPPSFSITVGVTRADNGGLVHFAQMHGATLATVVDYAVSLLLLPGRPYHLELRQCSLEQCGRFFLASRIGKGKGKPPTKFCPGRGCKDTHYRKTGAQRTAKSRAQPKKNPRRRTTTARKAK